MKTVLIALDYDPSAEKVARTGYAIAKSMKAKVILIHVVANPNYYSDIAYSPIMGFSGFLYPEIDQALEKNLITDSYAFLERSKEHLEDPAIETIVIEGDFVDSLLTACEEQAADLVVLGTHSRRGIDKLLSGHLSEAMLKETTVPLLIVPTNT